MNQVLVALDELRRDPLCEPFAEPVDTDQVAGYLDAISPNKPTDLGIHRKAACDAFSILSRSDIRVSFFKNQYRERERGT